MEIVDLAYLRVLVVEDVKETRAIMMASLRKAGLLIIEEAANGEEALTVLAEGEHSIDLVLCDLKMPVMDGFALLETIRSGGRPGIDARTPVILATGLDDPETRARVERYAIAGFLAKPFTREELIGEITRVIHAANEG